MHEDTAITQSTLRDSDKNEALQRDSQDKTGFERLHHLSYNGKMTWETALQESVLFPEGGTHQISEVVQFARVEVTVKLIIVA